MELSHDKGHEDIGWSFIQAIWLFLTAAFDAADPVFGPAGLSSKQVILLAVLEKADHPNELAKLLGTPPSTISNMLNDLEKKGYLVRELSHKDRRRLSIRRTEKGMETLAKGASLFEDSLRVLVGQLPADDRAALVRAGEVISDLTAKMTAFEGLSETRI